MPHIIVEHTKDINNISGLLGDLHASIAGQDTVDIGSLKTRSIPIENVVIGDGATQSMVHVTVRLLAGRPNDLLDKMTSDLQAIVIDHCDDETRITIESVDLFRASYKN